MRVPRRGEIYYLDFSPAKGSEMRGPHPALIIQNDVGNRVSRLTIVAAISAISTQTFIPSPKMRSVCATISSIA